MHICIQYVFLYFGPEQARDSKYEHSIKYSNHKTIVNTSHMFCTIVNVLHDFCICLILCSDRLRMLPAQLCILISCSNRWRRSTSAANEKACISPRPGGGAGPEFVLQLGRVVEKSFMAAPLSIGCFNGSLCKGFRKRD